MKTVSELVGILLLSCAAEAAQLVNPAFNEGLKGWSQGLPGWSVETGAGLNGSKGLVFRSETPVTPKWMLQRVTLKPGVRYRFGCWTKVNPVSPHAVAQFALEWQDKDGKWLGGGYMTCHKTGDAWRKVEQVTKEIPAAAAKAHLLVFFDPSRDGGIAGEFAFDDFFLEEADLTPLAAVTSGAYRDEVSEPGEVKLLAAAARPLGVAADDFSVTFAWKGPDGAMRTRTTSVTGSVASVSLDAGEIAFGTNDVVVTAQVRGRGKVGERRFPLARLTRPTPRRTYVDRFGRCVKDGKLFFPHGMYFSKATDDMLDLYTNSPFNVIMPYHPPTPEQMDSIARHGLLTFVSMQNNLCTDGKAAYAKLLEDRYGRFKRHPALFAWYVFDEAPLAEAERRALACETVRTWDPDRICWAVFCLEGVIPDFLGATDVIGVDPYPVGNRQKLSAVTDFCRAARAHTFGAKAMWNVPQAFDWGNYRKKQTDPHRMPTKEELRNMNWQHLANGANGLVSYSFFDLRRQANADADWQTVRDVAWEIDRYVPVILSEPGPAATAPKEVAVRTWRKDGEAWILAVNPNETDVACEVTAPGVSGTVVRELGDGAPTPCGDGRFAYRLGRYAVSLVRVVPSPATVREPDAVNADAWHGVNLLGLFSWSEKSEPAARFAERDFRWLSGWGFNFARLPVDYRHLMETNDWTRLKLEGFRKVDEAVAFGRKYGVHVQVCLHRAPGYTIASWLKDTTLRLQRDREPQEAFIRLWREFARRYRGVPNRELSFNLVNEPSGFTEEEYVDVFGRTVEAIRAIDPGRFVMLDGNRTASQPVPYFYKVPLTGQAFRGYTPHAISHYGASYIRQQPPVEPTWPMSAEMTTNRLWIYEQPEKTMAKFLPARKAGCPVMIGEFGCYCKVAHKTALAWMESCLKLWQKEGLGWAVWNLTGSFGFVDSKRTDVDYEDFEGHKLDRKMLELLRKYAKKDAAP